MQGSHHQYRRCRRNCVYTCPPPGGPPILPIPIPSDAMLRVCTKDLYCTSEELKQQRHADQILAQTQFKGPRGVNVIRVLWIGDVFVLRTGARDGCFTLCMIPCRNGCHLAERRCIREGGSVSTPKTGRRVPYQISDMP